MVVGEFTESAELVIIGSGPGGYVAALRAAQLGRSVTLVERHEIGGICLNVGCIPSKAIISVADQFHQLHNAGSRGIEIGAVSIDMAGLQRFKTGVVEKLTGGVKRLLAAQNVAVLQGEARFLGPRQIRVVSEYESKKVGFEQAIIATGSRPRTISAVPLDGEVVMSSTELLAMTRIPQHLVVVGGGYIGLELGTAFRKLGSQVTVLEASDQLLPGIDAELVRIVQRRLQQLGVTVQINALVTATTTADRRAEIAVTIENRQRQITADAVLVTVGRNPNTDALDLASAQVAVDERGFVIVDERLRTSNPSVAAIGDVVSGPMLAHKASYQAKIAAESLSGLAAAADAIAMPSVIFTDPEIAVAGLTPAQAQKQGYKPLVGRFPFAANGRALSVSQSAGEAMVVADEASGLLLGVQIAGPDASSLIAEGGLALEMGATLEDLALTVHAHPTLSEVLMEAAEAALGRPIHISVKRTG